MKEISVAVFALILTASTSYAGGCSKHNHTNLEAMSCQTGYTWDDEAKEFVQAPQIYVDLMVWQAVQLHLYTECLSVGRRRGIFLLFSALKRNRLAQ